MQKLIQADTTCGVISIFNSEEELISEIRCESDDVMDNVEELEALLKSMNVEFEVHVVE